MIQGRAIQPAPRRMERGFVHVSDAIVAHLRTAGGIRTLPELIAETDLPAQILRERLDLLEAAGLVWRRDLTMESDGLEVTEDCWWAPRVLFEPKGEVK